MQTSKHAARQIIGQATWDDIMYELYVKQNIEKGLKAIDEGCVLLTEDPKIQLL